MGCIKSHDIINLDYVNHNNIEKYSQPKQSSSYYDSSSYCNLSQFIFSLTKHDNRITNKSQTSKITINENTKEIILDNQININIDNPYKEQFKIIKTLKKQENYMLYKVQTIYNDNENEFKIMQIINKEILGKDTNIIKQNIEKAIKLQHHKILKVFEYFDDDEKIYIISEYLSEGNLYEFINKQGNKINENQIQYIFMQILEGVNALHCINMVHSHLNMRNILINRIKQCNNENCFQIKIKQHYFGNVLLPENDLDFYRSPEAINSKIKITMKLESDIWNLGILLFMLFTGNPPFEGKTQHEINNNIIQYNLNFIHNSSIPKEAIDLIEKMLDKNLLYRPNIIECLGHHWFKKSNEQELNNKILTEEQIINLIFDYLINQDINEIEDIFKKELSNNKKVISSDAVEHGVNIYIKNNHSNITYYKELINSKYISSLINEITDSKSTSINLTQFTKIIIIINKQIILKTIELLYKNNLTAKQFKQTIKSFYKYTNYPEIQNQLIQNLNKLKQDEIVYFEQFKNILISLNEAHSHKEDNNENKSEKSDDSFVIYSEEKIANKFDREKFLKLIQRDISGCSDLSGEDTLIQDKSTKRKRSVSRNK